MRQYLILCFVIAALSLTSCRKDFEFQPSNVTLEFSRDTVYLDTVFTNIGSSTYTLKVYNRSNRDISIPTIKLGKGMDSRYRIMVDGMVGDNNRIFNNVELLAKDSMYIFIETTANIADAHPNDFLYTDDIEFYNVHTTPQKVALVTLIQDAYFLYPQRFDDGTFETLPIGDQEIYGFILDENDPINGNEYIWGNTKPYVIYGYAAVPANKTLTVLPGARIHFHADSGLIIGNEGSLKVLGDDPIDPDNPLAQQIIFQGDRLEPLYQNIPGQWGTIWFTLGSKNNELRNCIIKNATVGMFVTGNSGLQQPQADIQLRNVQIYSSSASGILARNGYITGENVVINRAGQFCFAGTYGGSYEFVHSTFNNNWQSSRQASVYLDNFIQGAQPESQPIVKADFHNCIIYGSNQLQMVIDNRGSEPLNYYFNHCLIRFNNVNNQFTNNPLYQFASDPTRYNQIYLATNSVQFNPNFLSVNNNRLLINEDSPVVGLGDPAYFINRDVVNRNRTSPPDLGAYQNHPFPE